MPSNKSVSDAPITQFINCRILRDNELQREDLWVREGRILDPEKLFFDEQGYADKRVDCGGSIIAPGFIDVQINGGYGIDFSQASEDVSDGVSFVAKKILEHGVTSFCPTLVTSPPEVYHKVLPQVKVHDGGPHGAGVLGEVLQMLLLQTCLRKRSRCSGTRAPTAAENGVCFTSCKLPCAGFHLEGPFISAEKKGAHPEKYLRTFKSGGLEHLMEVYGSLDDVAIVTLAPELPGSQSVVRELSQRGITVSLGHSAADLSQAEEAVQQGASFITHLFNAMLPFHHRDPGIVGLLTSDRIPAGRVVYYGMIADGIHTNPAALRIAHRAHPSGLVLVTDAITAMGLPPGRHTLGQQVIEIQGLHAYVAGTKTLSGSIATMDMCVRHFKQVSGCSVQEALEAASLHPAQLLGISPKKGKLDYGSDADLVLLDEGLNVKATYISGEEVWRKGQ
uniref:N-acetylglucosamine-6-phosphate deacetylase n=1 Tax=Astatotilapia calliptera TaxID=8154 RepID=A0A3P8QA27_ASTCA